MDREKGVGMVSETGVESVAYSVVDEVATITLNRPDLRNRMTVEMLAQAHELLGRAAEDDGVRVVVLTGAGNTFCAGADLAGASDAAAADSKWSGPKAIVHVLNAILDHPKPVIARVQGHVAGGGNGLVAACDLSIAVESAKFAFSEVRLGVAPAVISVVCLDKMSVADGFDLLLTGERVSATRAKEAGLLNKVVADDALYAAIRLLDVVAGTTEPVSAMRDRMAATINTPELRAAPRRPRSLSPVVLDHRSDDAHKRKEAALLRPPVWLA